MGIVFACCAPVLLGAFWLGRNVNGMMIVVVFMLLALKIVFEWINREDQFLPLLTLLINSFLTINFRMKLWVVVLVVLVSTGSGGVWEALTY